MNKEPATAPRLCTQSHTHTHTRTHTYTHTHKNSPSLDTKTESSLDGCFSQCSCLIFELVLSCCACRKSNVHSLSQRRPDVFTQHTYVPRRVNTSFSCHELGLVSSETSSASLGPLTNKKLFPVRVAKPNRTSRVAVSTTLQLEGNAWLLEVFNSRGRRRQSAHRVLAGARLGGSCFCSPRLSMRRAAAVETPRTADYCA